LFINVVWDVVTRKTPKFHISGLRDKISVLFSAAGFCSNLLLILRIFFPSIGNLADTPLALVLAGATGMLWTIPAICPYDRHKKPTRHDSQ